MFRLHLNLIAWRPGQTSYDWKSIAPIYSPHLAPIPSTGGKIIGLAYCGLYHKHITIVNDYSSREY